MDVKLEWHSPDQHWVATFMRRGEPWILNGALVGFGGDPGDAVNDLCEIAEYLVIHGENFLTDNPLSLRDRCWLYNTIEHAGREQEMYSALRAACGSSSVKMLEMCREVREEESV